MIQAKGLIVQSIGGCIFGILSSVAMADGSQLIRALSSTELSAMTSQQSQAIADLRKDKTYRAVTAVTIDRDAFLSTVVNVTIGTTAYQFKKNVVTSLSPSHFTWGGNGQRCIAVGRL